MTRSRLAYAIAKTVRRPDGLSDQSYPVRTIRYLWDPVPGYSNIVGLTSAYVFKKLSWNQQCGQEKEIVQITDLADGLKVSSIRCLLQRREHDPKPAQRTFSCASNKDVGLSGVLG